MSAMLVPGFDDLPPDDSDDQGGWAPAMPLPSAFDIRDAWRDLEAAGGAQWEDSTEEQRQGLAFDAAAARVHLAEQAAGPTDLEVLDACVAANGGSSLASSLDDVVAHLRRFVYLPRATQYDAVALWAAHTHAIDACEFSPILNVTSAVMRCGKSRLLEAIEHVVAKPWKAIQPSEPVLFRTIHEDRPTLMLDEADAQFNAAASRRGDTEPVRAILNAGNRRGTVVPRMVATGRTFQRQDFSVFCAKIVAGIGDLPATVVDRAIVVVMERKRAEDRVERLRLRDIERISTPLRDALARDGWEPLLAIARLAGRDWPARALAAALDLSAGRSAHADEDPALLLLADARTAMGEDDAVTASQLVERLAAMPESPWSSWRGDKSITARGVAVLLRRFGIASHRDRGSSRWHRADFAEAWSRYLDSSATSATSATPGESSNESRVADEVPHVRQQVRQAETGHPPHGSPASLLAVADVAVVGSAPAVDAVFTQSNTTYVEDAPLCEDCGRRMRAVPGQADRFVCTFPHGRAASLGPDWAAS
jgi:hypothetical protein